jgi:tripartite-type tricarboxylate transporter receptor subunit TctC
MRRTRSRLLGAALATTGMTLTLAACDGSSSASSGGELRRPVDMVVPFGPGGGADSVARTAGKAMEEPLGVEVPVLNVPGATGNTGIAKMLASRPGEAMAILIQDTLATVEAGGASFSVDELRAVCRLQSMPSALLVRKEDYGSWEELADTAERDPGGLKVATVGANSVDDIVLAALAENAGTEFQAVPYSEPSERYAALLGGEVDALYEQLGDVKQYLDSDDFQPVLLLSEEKVEGFDGVPTAADVGLPAEVVLPQFRGIVVSSDASDAQVETLSGGCAEAADTSEMESFQADVFAADDSYQDAEDFQAFLEEQSELIGTQLEAYGLGEGA